MTPWPAIAVSPWTWTDKTFERRNRSSVTWNISWPNLFSGVATVKLLRPRATLHDTVNALQVRRISHDRDADLLLRDFVDSGTFAITTCVSRATTYLSMDSPRWYMRSPGASLSNSKSKNCVNTDTGFMPHTFMVTLTRPRWAIPTSTWSTPSDEHVARSSQRATTSISLPSSPKRLWDGNFFVSATSNLREEETPTKSSLSRDNKKPLTGSPWWATSKLLSSCPRWCPCSPVSPAFSGSSRVAPSCPSTWTRRLRGDSKRSPTYSRSPSAAASTLSPRWSCPKVVWKSSRRRFFLLKIVNYSEFPCFHCQRACPKLTSHVPYFRLQLIHAVPVRYA